MPNIKTINNRVRQQPQVCYVYTDEMAFNAANNAAKKLRRGQTFHSKMSMSSTSLEILMNSYSSDEYEIVGTSADGFIYAVTIHRYTRIEQWLNKRGKRAHAIKEDIDFGDEDCSW